MLIAFIGLKSQEDKRLEKGIEKFNFQEYAEAIELFKKVLENNKESYKPLKYIANSYRKINDYSNAELYFTLVVNSDSSIAEDFLYYGQTLKANGKLAAAKEQFSKFAELAGNQFLGNLMLQSIDEIESWDQDPKVFQSNSKTELNTSLSEYNLVRFRDRYYITSNRDIDHNSPESFSWTGKPFLSIYEIDSAQFHSGDMEFTAVSGQLNTEYHDGPLTIDESETRVIITRIDNQLRGKKFVNRMKLYEGKYENGKWRSFTALPFNSDDYNVGHACFADSNTLYFASDMPGGYGGMDIYVSQRENEIWGTPKNLGASINTQQNEVFPYLKDEMLYFSSNGFSGYGGLDIFVSEYSQGWLSPINLKSPINSTRDDFGIYFITDTTGYYASNRLGGKGEDDLYTFYQSSSIQSLGVSGLLEFRGLPAEGVEVDILNAEDSLLAVAYTDEKGRFYFTDLSYQEDYFFQIVEEDVDLYEEGRIYLTNKQGDKIQLLNRLKDGKFNFKALPVEEIELSLLAAFDKDELGDLRFAGRIFKKLPGDFQDEMMVYLLDEEGNVVDSILSDPFGNFNFEKLELDPSKNYFVQLPLEDDDLNLALVNDDGRIYEVAEAKDGKFVLSEPIDASKTKQLAADKGLTSLLGIAELNGQPLTNTRVLLYNSNSRLIASLFTNEKGEFQFNKLQIDESYFADLPTVDDSLNPKIYVINESGEHLYLINQLVNGKYEFKALPFDEYVQIQIEEASFVPDLVELKGQIFTKLPGDYNEALKVYLLDEEGEILDSVYTNAEGKFNFEKLQGDQQYSFKLEEDTEVNLALLGEEEEILEQAILTDQGNFTYKKLTYQVAQFDPLEEVDADLVEDELTQIISGQVYQKLPGDFDHGMEVYIYDENGVLIGTTQTDEHGNFNFKKLKADATYHFRIEHEDEDFQLVTLDDERNILNKIVKNKNGLFKYNQLGLDHHEVILEEFEDHHQVVYIDNQKFDLDTFTVHYRFDSTLLNTVAKDRLNRFVLIFKDESLRIEVQSHTDIRGPKEYNELLSKQRTDNVIQYLVQNGIAKKRIIGKYFGELKPLVDCENKECDNDDHFQNRRTELKLVKATQ